MATIDQVNALNIRPRTIIRILVYDHSGSNLLLTITEAELIRATVSLRSDLSRINPTLPESDIEIEAYFDTDVSDSLADAGDGLQIRYRWWPDTASYGYNRYFYTDERITWSNNILHIHAVDQVHLLDEELPPIYLGQDWYWNNSSSSNKNVLHGLYLAFFDFVRGTKDSNTGLQNYFTNAELSYLYGMEGTFTTIPDGGALNILQPRMTRREAIAKIMNCCHWDLNPGEVNTFVDFWPTFVDAGQPRLRANKPSSTPTKIYVEDCGDFQESKEPVYNSITATVNEVLWLGAGSNDETYDENMKSRIVKQQGISFEYSGYGDHYNVGAEDPDIPLQMYYFYVRPYSDDNNARKRPPVDAISSGTSDQKAIRNQYGKWLLDGGVAMNSWSPSPNDYSFLDLSGAKWTSPITPGSPDTPASLWSYWESVDIMPTGSDSTDAINAATFFITTDERTITKTRGGSGDSLVLDDLFLSGHAIVKKYDGSGNITFLPDKALECILNKSNVVGSFKWKGDPRMQPRDFIELVYGEGELTNENGVVLQTENGEDIVAYESAICTIENITLTHENGGTIAEITYRKGYC